MENEKQKTLPKNPPNNKYLIITIIILIVVSVGAYFVGYYYGKSVTQDIYEEKISNYAQFIPGLYAKNDEVKTIEGTIEQINGNIINLKANKLTSRLFDLGEETTYQVEINDNTKIYKNNPFNIDLLLNPENNSGQNSEQQLSINDLKIGDIIKATSEENIMNQNSFLALTISIKNASDN